MIPNRFPANFGDMQCFLLLGQASTQVINIVISFAGRIDETRLRQAMRQSLDAEPILGCQFVEHWYRPEWRRRSDLDQLELCRVVESTELEPLLGEFAVRSIDPRYQPLVEAVIFRDVTDTLCLKMSHVAGDAHSLAAYVTQLADLYRKLEADSGYVPEPNVHAVRDLRPVARQFSLRQKLGILRELSRRVGKVGKFQWIIPAHPTQTFRGYLTLKLPPAQVEVLKRFGRDRRSTITVIVLAALFRALQATMRPASDEKAIISTTTDLRRFLPIPSRNTGPANLVGPVGFWLKPGGDDSLDQTVETIRSQLKNDLKDPRRSAFTIPVIATFPVLRWLFRLLPYSMLKKGARRALGRIGASPLRFLGLANVGTFEPELLALGDVPVRAIYFLGPIFNKPGIQIVMSSFGQATNISLAFCDDSIEEPAARRLLEQIDRELPGFTGSLPEIERLGIADPLANAPELIQARKLPVGIVQRAEVQPWSRDSRP